MKIYIPHIHYTVNVKSIDSYKGAWIGSKGICRRDNKDSSTVFLSFPIKRNNFPTLAHELVHVLQNICEDRAMILETEKENMAYLMNYLINKILALKYVRK